MQRRKDPCSGVRHHHLSSLHRGTDATVLSQVLKARDHPVYTHRYKITARVLHCRVSRSSVASCSSLCHTGFRAPQSADWGLNRWLGLGREVLRQQLLVLLSGSSRLFPWSGRQREWLAASASYLNPSLYQRTKLALYRVCHPCRPSPINLMFLPPGQITI